MNAIFHMQQKFGPMLNIYILIINYYYNNPVDK